MAKTKPKHTKIWETPKPASPCTTVDLAVLGSSIGNLPPGFWRERMFFHGALDNKLKVLTGEFPATYRKDHRTHPIFVLNVLGDLGHRVCPCSSKNWGASRFIRKGCILEITGREQDRDSFLVERYAFNLPSDPAFCQEMRFMGVVPECCLESCD